MLSSTRRSGVLLHPTSLPGAFGRGDLGKEAHAFVSALARAGQTVWQTLPLHPAGYGGSPYAGSSAFAGDPLLISPEVLVEEGLLDRAELETARFPEGRVAFESEPVRRRLLRLAFQAFQSRAKTAERAALEEFRAANAYWIEDWALFAALKDEHDLRAFWEWKEEPVRRAQPAALRALRRSHRTAIEAEVFFQHLFQRQWSALHAHARELGVLIMGDLPIFVARDSADVWGRPELFCLDARGELEVQAGVPPDLFTADGQLWGNPLYDWKVHARTAYAWWTERLRRAIELADLVRIDHFRAFSTYWEIPAGAKNARGGRWLNGPRMAFFDAIRANLGELPIVAEDLGEVTPDVPELLAQSGFPGMKVLQFAWDADPRNPFKPENVGPNSVIYTGTHDNETTAGWFRNLDPDTRRRVEARVAGAGPVWGMIEMALASKAFLAVIPAQDLLELGNEARMNSPGTCEGNWTWRLLPGQLDEATLARLGSLAGRHGRVPRPAGVTR